jgi:hypothetical protein
VIEEGHQRAMLQAELERVRSVIADLESGQLAWTPEQLCRLSS